jgi:hypothetical protein
MPREVAIVSIVATLSSFATLMGVIWLIVRTRQRRNELHADVQMKLIEKFGSSAEFVHFLESQAGRDFLHQPMIDARRRVISGISGGTVLGCLGLGFLVLGFGDDGFFVPAFILIALGAGFIVSAALSMKLMKRLPTDPTPSQP